jgi:hypothetical protein
MHGPGRTAIANDFDFRAGNKHFRGNGWRGLVALGLWLIVRGTIFVVAIIASKPTVTYLFGFWR